MTQSAPEFAILERPGRLRSRARCAAGVAGSAIGFLIANSFSATRPNFIGAEHVDLELLRRDGIDHAIRRLKSFRNLSEDWDGEGADAPRKELVDEALSFLARLQPWHPRPMATMDRDGCPVVEFSDDSPKLSGSVKFLEGGAVEIYVSFGGDRPSEYFEGLLASEDARRFLSNNLQVTLLSR